MREGGEADLDALASISRDVRGAPHTTELAYALNRGARLVRLDDRGFAVAEPGGGVWLLVARDETAASALLWSALELAGEGQRPMVRWITGGQDWAVDIVVCAGDTAVARRLVLLPANGEKGRCRPALRFRLISAQ